MTEQEAIKKISDICKGLDEEREHVETDNLIIDFLYQNGFKELSAAYDKASENFWYA